MDNRQFIDGQSITALMPVTIPCETLIRAQKFYDNGMAFVEMGEYYSALVNLALAANTLTELRNLAQYVHLPSECLQQNPQFCETQNETLCSLDVAIDKILRKVQVLKSKVIELRGGGPSSSSGPGSSGNCSSTNNVRVQWTPKDCRKYCFARIVGAIQAKQDIINSFVNPILYPNMYGKVSKGILLYGMPGTGKTLLAKATATELERKSRGTLKVLLFTPKGSELKGKYFGETEQKIADLFECASKMACSEESNQTSHMRVLSIIFIDEIDAVGRERSSGDSSGIQASSVNALLQAMDGIKSYPNVAVLAATNFPWELDSAILRRFESHILVDLPTLGDIEHLLNIHISDLVTNIIPYKDIMKLCHNEDTQSEPMQRSCNDDDWNACNNVTQSDYAWLDMKHYFKDLSESAIASVSKSMATSHYSGSDVHRYFQQVVRLSAENAMKNGWFMTGPNVDAFANDNLDDSRALISTLGLSLQPWALIKDVIKDLPEDTELKISPMAESMTLVSLELYNNKYYNMYGNINLKFLPYQTDTRIRNTLLFVDSGNQQPEDPVEAKVLFHIAVPVTQSAHGHNTTAGHTGIPDGLTREFILKHDQFQIQKALRGQSLSKINVPTKKDLMHAFIEVNVDFLQSISNVSRGFFENYLFGVTQQQKYINVTKSLSSLLFTILESKAYNMYLLIGNDMYIPNDMDNFIESLNDVMNLPIDTLMGQQNDWSTLDKLLKIGIDIHGPMYTIENHPLNPWKDNHAQNYYTVVQSNIVLQSSNHNNDGLSIAQDIRFVNWSITDNVLYEVSASSRATFNKGQYDNIINYAKDPVAFMDEQRTQKDRN